ncbi:hypothetical protein ACFY7Y_14515 [Streptomyces virginiae]
MDLLVAAVAGLVFAVALRVRWYVPVGDGLALAASVLVLYVIAAAAIR